MSVFESKIRRAGGSKISIGNRTYHFKPSGADDRHLCDVTDPAHKRVLFGIPDGYTCLDVEQEGAPEASTNAFMPPDDDEGDEGDDGGGVISSGKPVRTGRGAKRKDQGVADLTGGREAKPKSE